MNYNKFIDGNFLVLSDENNIYKIDTTKSENEDLINKINSLNQNTMILVFDEEDNVIDVVEDVEKLKQQELSYIAVEDKPSVIEVQFAEYILQTEDRIINLENLLGGM